jgi:pyruvate dehydrogenase E1 component beta subunit
VRREGRDVSLITYGGTLGKTLAAADALAGEGDLGGGHRPAHPAAARHATILASVARTHRAVVVDEGWRSGSLSAESRRASWRVLLRARRAGRAGVQRRGADAVREAPRGRGPAAGARIVEAARRALRGGA